VSARGLVPLSVVGDVLVAEAGWARLPREALEAQAAELAAELRVPVMPGWHQVSSVGAAGADVMIAAAKARRDAIQAEIGAAIAGARDEPASAPLYPMTDRPGMPSFQHTPRAGRIA
jgi:hypothetical protein